MTPITNDAGVKLHSPSTDLMKLVNIHPNTVGDTGTTSTTWTDFTTITNYIQEHLYDIIYEMHHTYDKLLLDDGEVQINCPPHTEDDSHHHTTSDTNHSTLLLRTLSEKEATNGSGITAKREIKVYDCGPVVTEDEDDTNLRSILIREDVVQASHDVNDTHPILTEQSITIRVPQKKF